MDGQAVKVENGAGHWSGERLQSPRGQIDHLDDRSRWSDLIHAAARPAGVAKCQGTGVLVRQAVCIAIDVP
jgi:hypothetical protein